MRGRAAPHRLALAISVGLALFATGCTSAGHPAGAVGAGPTGSAAAGTTASSIDPTTSATEASQPSATTARSAVPSPVPSPVPPYPVPSPVRVARTAPTPTPTPISGADTGVTTSTLGSISSSTSMVTTTSLAPVNPMVVHLASFRMPSGNVGCRLGSDAGGAFVSCTIADIAATFASGPATAVPCGSLAAWTHTIVYHRHAFDLPCGPRAELPAGPVLAYGQVDAGGLLSCHSAESGLTCQSWLDGTGFGLTRAGAGFTSGEGDQPVVTFPTAGNRVAVAPVTGRHIFQSHDHSVSCTADAGDFGAHVYCIPTVTRFPRPADAMGCAGGGDPIAVLDVFAGVSVPSVACNGPFGVGTVRGDTDLDNAASFPAGGVVAIRDLNCTIETSSIRCVGPDGSGFALDATTYQPLPN